MIEGFPPHFGRLDKNFQVVDQLWLTGKFFDGRRTNIILKLLVRRGQRVFVIIEVEIGHKQIYRVSGNIPAAVMYLTEQMYNYDDTAAGPLHRSAIPGKSGQL